MKHPWFLAPIAGALVGLALLQAFAPQYLLHQGFPLDDAWIHAVYARELARTGTLAYNPGVAATGETSPLWALVVSIVHAAVHSRLVIVAGTKLVGFALHMATVVALGFALAPAAKGHEWLAWLAAALVGIHPDLVAASVSGMEVPLATFICAMGIAAVVRGQAGWLAGAGALGFAARPETVVLTSAFAFLFWIRTDARRAVTLAAAGASGGVAAAILLGLRNHAVSGRWLPATFYAKANTQALFDPMLQVQGFAHVFGEITLVNRISFVLVALACAVVLLVGARELLGRAAAALYASGIFFCAVSFALTPPIDAHAFYHQRYILPALPFIVVSLPLLATAIVDWFTKARPALTGATAAGLSVAIACLILAAAAAPARAERLSSDAHNIDDVQVAFGEALAGAPAGDAVWVVDAGASRFFGSAFVVDMMGLNTPELLTPDAQAFLDRHPPSFLDLFPSWSSASTDAGPLRARVFETTTPYTVTSFPAMRMHGLAACEPPGAAGRMTVRSRSFTFHCAQ